MSLWTLLGGYLVLLAILLTGLVWAASRFDAGQAMPIGGLLLAGISLAGGGIAVGLLIAAIVDTLR
jgi:hypothetical protein